MSEKTNFILFITDQQRHDWLGCYGHPVLRTPNIDEIAARGLRFDNFHVASPVCMPNRASIMTGRYPSVHGLRYNGCYLPRQATTFVDLLRASGYRTASIGKSHLQPFTDSEVVTAKDVIGTINEEIPEAWNRRVDDYAEEEPDRYQGNGRHRFRTPYYGFDHVDMVTGHGDTAGGHYLQWLREQTKDWATLRQPEHQLPHDYNCPQAKRTRLPAELYPTRYIENQACDWLSEHASGPEPFFLFVSFPDPHHPFNPPGEYWQRYQPEQFDIGIAPADFPIPPAPVAHTQAMRAQEIAPKTPYEAIAATDQQCREAMSLTAGMIDMIDDAVGNIVDRLHKSSAKDDTVLLFTSDHGDYLGDANLLFKGPWIRRSLHQVPFIWADPKRPNSASTSVLGCSIDIAPTILKRAGVSPYFGIQGRDLLDDVSSGEGRSQLLIEHNDNNPRMGFTRPARSRTLYRNDWRLTLYAGEAFGELYDQAADPNHLNNLWTSPDHGLIKSNMLEQLALEMTGTMDESPRAVRQA